MSFTAKAVQQNGFSQCKNKTIHASFSTGTTQFLFNFNININLSWRAVTLVCDFHFRRTVTTTIESYLCDSLSLPPSCIPCYVY